MFSALLQRIEERCVVLSNVLLLYDVLDEAITDDKSPINSELSRRGISLTNTTEDRIFRHCAVMSQLYGLYESFAESMLSSWLVRLPKYYNFSELPVGFKNAYNNGIARIIQKVDLRRYEHLSLPSVVEKYLAALQGVSPWEFVDDALTHHDANLRQSEFVTMFGSVNLTEIWPSLERNRHIRAFKSETGSDESLDNLILDLVNIRNEASHGTPDEILSSDVLREWIVFVRAFCTALADVVTHRIVIEEVKKNPDSIIGMVTEEFSENVIIAVCERGSIRVGDTIYFLRTTDCTGSMIESLQVDDVAQKEIQLNGKALEIGIRTTLKVYEKSQLVRLDSEILGAPVEVSLTVEPISSGEPISAEPNDPK